MTLEWAVTDGLVGHALGLSEGLECRVLGLGETLHDDRSLCYGISHSKHHAVRNSPLRTYIASTARPAGLNRFYLGLLRVHLDDDSLGTLTGFPAELDDHSFMAFFAKHFLVPLVGGDILSTI